MRAIPTYSRVRGGLAESPSDDLAYFGKCSPYPEEGISEQASVIT